MNRLPELAASDRPSTRAEGAAPCALDDAALTALAAAHQGVGARIGFRGDRHQRYRSLGCRSRPRRLAGSRIPRRNGLYGETWDETRASGRTCGRYATRDLRPARLSAGRIARPDAAESEPGALALHDWRAREQAGSTIRRRPSCRSMRAAATITRCCATACRRSPSASSRRSARSATACSPIRRPCSRSSAQKAGVGWRGKHTLLLQRDAGPLFFLGEIYVDVPLPTDAHTSPTPRPRRLAHTAAAARAASTPARPVRSSSRTASTRAAASRT